MIGAVKTDLTKQNQQDFQAKHEELLLDLSGWFGDACVSNES